MTSQVSTNLSMNGVIRATPSYKNQVFNLNTRYPYFTKEQGDYFGKSD